MKITPSIIALTLAAALGACASQETAPVETVAAETAAPVVEIAPATITAAEAAYVDGAYALNWTASADAAPVDVFVSASPDGADAVMIADDDLDGALTWTPEDGEKSRRYFVVVPEGGEPAVIATRLLPLEGGRNFRDLGGYETADGRSVKWGTLFRSGVMNGLTASDYEYLSDLGINVVCDLRTAQERAAEPTEWKAGEIQYLTFADPQEDRDANPLVQVFQDPEATPEKVAAMMTELYSGILEQQAPAYRVMFDELANGALPLAFNCSAGKDRTGVGAALILSTLGVPRETVVADYALSEVYVDYAKAFEVGEDGLDEDSPYAFLRQLPPEMVAPLLRSDPAYITAVLDEIDAEYGDVTAYVQTELGVDDAELESIRDRLLAD